MLDPLEAVIHKLIDEWPEIKAPRVTELLRDEHGYQGSVDLVRKRLATIRPKQERPAQRTGYRPAQVMQVDWGRDADEAQDRRPRAPRLRLDLLAALLGRLDRPLHLRDDRRVVHRGSRPRLRWLGGVPRECVYDNLRSAVARREGDEITWNQRFTQLRPLRLHATACTPETPREKGSVEGAVRHTKTGFWPPRRFDSLGELDRIYADWRDRIALPRRHSSGHFVVADRLAVERETARALPPVRFDYAGRRPSRVPLDGYLKHRGSFYRAPESLVHQRVELRFDRDRVWIEHQGRTVADYERSYMPGSWQPAPRMRPEPPPPPAKERIALPEITPPALADYAELCA